MSLAAHSPDEIRTSMRNFLSILLGSLLLFGVSGCGGGETEPTENGKSSSSADIEAQVEELISETEALAEEAKKAEAEKYKATDFTSAKKVLAKAKDYMADGEAKKARSQIRSAKRKFESILEDVSKIASQMKEIEADLKKYEEKMAAAKAADIETLAKTEYEGALRSFSKAEKYIADGKSSSAKKYLRYAIGDLDMAMKEIAKKSDEKNNADQEKQLMADMRQQAIDAGAEEKALRDLEYARDRERLGDQAYTRGDFEGAARNFRDAKTGFVGALETAKRADVAVANNSGSNDNGSRNNGGSDEVPGLDDISIPDIGIGDSGSADLSSGLPGLFKGVAEYDSSKGSLRLNWSDGSELFKDMKRVSGDPSHAIFEGDEGVGSGQDGNYVMAGNTKGFWLVNSSFEDGVRIRAKVQFQLLINKPDFEIVLMADEGGDFYAVSYGANARVYSNGLKTSTVVSPVKMYRKSPKDWVQKREAYDIEILYVKRNEDEKGILEAKINGETTVKLTTDKYRKGFPGIRWKDTKFIIQELEISGLVDEEWAEKEISKSPEDSSGGSEDDFDF